MTSKIEKYSISFICLGFLTIYSSTVYWGLPQKLDPDELIFVFAAMEMFSPPYFHPGWFGAPAATLIDLLALIYGLLATLGTLFGHYGSIQEFNNLLWKGDGIPHYITGRLVSAIFAALSLFLTYKIVRKYTSFYIALVALVLTGLSTSYVYYAAVIRMDMLQIFGLLGCVYICTNCLEEKHINLKSNLLLGLFFAISVFSKYPSITFVIPIMYTYFLVSKGLKAAFIQFLTFGFAVLFFSFLLSPYFFLDFPTVINDVIKESRSYHLSQTSLGFWEAIVKYYAYSLQRNFGLIALILGSIGIFIAATIKGPRVILLGFLSYLIFISSLNLWWDRWILPLIPLFAIFVAIGLHHIFLKLKLEIKLWAILPLLILLSFHNISNSAIQISNRVQNNYTHLAAAKWMDHNIAKGSSILVDRYAPQILFEKFNMYARDCQMGLIHGSELTFSKRARINRSLNECNSNDKTEIFEQAVEHFAPDFLVRANIYERYIQEINAGLADKEKLREYEYIFKKYDLIKSFQSSRVLVGSNIYIYKRNF